MRVFVVENSAPVFEQLRRSLACLPWVQLVGHAGGEQRAFERIHALRPELVLVDLMLDEGSGLSLLRRLREAQAPCCIWVLTQFDEPRYRKLAQQLGAAAFFAKVTQSQAMLEALRAALPPEPDASTEGSRLQALQASGMFDDDAPSLVFDSVCRQAQGTLGYDMACITLIGADDVKVKASVGGPCRVLSRGAAPCSHVLAGHGALLWQDGAPDGCEYRHPTLHAAGWTSFAAVPLRIDSGEVLGALSLFGRQPRKLAAGELDWLNSLAQAAACELEWRVCLSRGASRWPDSCQGIGASAALGPVPGALTDGAEDAAALRRIETTFERQREELPVDAPAAARTVALLKFDIDGYRFVRDGLSDSQLREMFALVRGRTQAALPEGAMVEHLGGDEFVVLLPMTDASLPPADLARRLLAALSAPMLLDGTARRLTCSLGLALAPQHGLEAETLLAHAEQARLVAKAQGGNCARLYSPVLHQTGLQHLALESELALAIERGAIDLAFQPQWNLRDGSLAGVEALARWWHPRFGAVAPITFIALAEQRGLIKPLGALILERALQALAGWQLEGIAPRRLAINVSTAQFDADFVDGLSAALLRHGIDARQIELEFTESLGLAESPTVQALAERVIGMGATIAIDDFGTGHSTLDLLRRLPATTLKIDRSFVHGLQTGDRNWRVLAAVVDLAKRLDMRTVAEGVETDAERQIVTELGCSDAQGYWLARPMRADAMTPWLRDHARTGLAVSSD